MNVLVAIRAGRADVGEHRFLVALAALCVNMQSFQFKTCDRMVEFLHPALFIPGLFGVAQYTIQIHVAMGIADPGSLVFALAEGGQGDQQQKQEKAFHRSSPRGAGTLT
jgi:hypothetical protein